MADPAHADHIASPGDVGFVAEINTGGESLFALHNLSYDLDIVEITITLGHNAVFDTAIGPSGHGDVDPVKMALEQAGAAAPILDLSPGTYGITFSVDGSDSVGLVGAFALADGAGSATFAFGGFGPNESFGFFVDYDTADGTHVRPPMGKDTRVMDGHMEGGRIDVTFSNHQTLSYEYHPRPVGGKVSFPAMALVQVPEPALAGLLALGLVSLGRRRPA